MGFLATLGMTACFTRRCVLSCRAKRSIPLPSAPPMGFLATLGMTACFTRRHMLSCRAKRSIPLLRRAAHGVPRKVRNDSLLYAPPYAVMQSKTTYPIRLCCHAERSEAPPLPSAPPMGFPATPGMTACFTRRRVLSCRAKRSIPQPRRAAHGVPRNARNDNVRHAPPCAVMQSEAKHPPAKARCPWDFSQRSK